MQEEFCLLGRDSERGGVEEEEVEEEEGGGGGSKGEEGAKRGRREIGGKVKEEKGKKEK